MDELIPKYYRLKKDIIGMINREEIVPNQQIPTERELTEKYGVSRITVRKAVDELVNEGYLYRIQGKGTYVKTEDFNRDLFSIVSCTEDIKRMGMIPSRKLLDQKVEYADIKRRKLLDLKDKEKVFVVNRVYYADHEPVNVTISYLNYQLFPGIENINFQNASLYETIEKKYGIKILHATRTLEAVTIDQNVAKTLNMKRGDPALLFHAVTYGSVAGAEVPIETFICYYRSDKFKFYINQIR